MGRKYSKKGKNLTENFSNSHEWLLVWKIVFTSELQIISCTFLCKNFFPFAFLVEIQIKVSSPLKSDIGLGGGVKGTNFNYVIKKFKIFTPLPPRDQNIILVIIFKKFYPPSFDPWNDNKILSHHKWNIEFVIYSKFIWSKFASKKIWL